MLSIRPLGSVFLRGFDAAAMSMTFVRFICSPSTTTSLASNIPYLIGHPSPHPAAPQSRPHSPPASSTRRTPRQFPRPRPPARPPRRSGTDHGSVRRVSKQSQTTTTFGTYHSHVSHSQQYTLMPRSFLPQIVGVSRLACSALNAGASSLTFRSSTPSLTRRWARQSSIKFPNASSPSAVTMVASTVAVRALVRAP